MTSRPLRVLLVHPGALCSTSDVEAGLFHGLTHHGVEVTRFRLDGRLQRAKSWMYFNWRKAKKENPDIQPPKPKDIHYLASVGALERALKNAVDVVIVVACRHFDPDVLILLKRAGLRVCVLMTESPYDMEYELMIAGLVDGGWTNERSVVGDFQKVNRNFGYLPAAWHPDRHYVGVGETRPHAPSHDVVFVGTGWPERAAWFNAIDWTGIDLGLYGLWKDVGLSPALQGCVKSPQIDNRYAAALYGKAKIGLNLYRTSTSFDLGLPQNYGRQVTRADSLNPRAYELAACGRFHLSEFRPEVVEIFGDLVPTFRTPAEASALIRRWLSDAEGRFRVASQLPACVAESSWADRAACVIGDIDALIHGRTSAVSVTAAAV